MQTQINQNLKNKLQEAIEYAQRIEEICKKNLEEKRDAETNKIFDD